MWCLASRSGEWIRGARNLLLHFFVQAVYHTWAIKEQILGLATEKGLLSDSSIYGIFRRGILLHEPGKGKNSYFYLWRSMPFAVVCPAISCYWKALFYFKIMQVSPDEPLGAIIVLKGDLNPLGLSTLPFSWHHICQWLMQVHISTSKTLGWNQFDHIWHIKCWLHSNHKDEILRCGPSFPSCWAWLSLYQRSG